MKLFTKTLSAALCAAAFSMAAPQVFAASVNLTNNGEAFGGATEMSVMRTPGENPLPVMWIGGFDTTINSTTGITPFTAGQNILTWCIEVARHFPTGVSANYNVIENAADTWVDSLKRLFTMFGSTIGTGVDDAANRVTSAAMQLAVWEVIGDTGAGPYSLSSGGFQAASTASTGSADAWNTADGWLTALNNNPNAWNDGYKIVKLENFGDEPKLQDLVTFIPTPLPGAALLFLSALGLGGLARRKAHKTDDAAGALAA